MRTRKQANNDRVRRMAAHRDNPAAPVDASTLLSAEARRLRAIGKPLARRMAWAMELAAARLEVWGDPASLVMYTRTPHNPTTPEP